MDTNQEVGRTPEATTAPVEKKRSRTQIKKSPKELAFERDTRMVKGRFRCHELAGGTIRFHFRKYKSIPLKSYEFVDGEIYEIPYMIAEHLSKNCWYPVHNYLQDENGKVHSKVGQKVSRCSFEPLDFVEMADYRPSDIVTVEKI